MMKKIIGAAVAVSLLLTAACGGADINNNTAVATDTVTQSVAMPKARTVKLVPVPEALPAARTEAETVKCMTAALKVDPPFTGKTKKRLRQARKLAVGTEVVIDGQKVALKAGEHIYGLCSGPSKADVAARDLEIAKAKLENADRMLKAAKADNADLAKQLQKLTNPSKAKAAKIEPDSNWTGWLPLAGLILALALAGILAYRHFANNNDDQTDTRDKPAPAGPRPVAGN